MQQGIRCRMHMQSGRHQEEQRLVGAQLSSRKVSEALELAAGLVPRHSRPVVQTLQGQVNILVGLEFDDGEASLPGDGEHVDHGAIGSRKRRYLGIQTGGIQTFVHCRDVAHDQRFQPAFGMQPP